MKSDYFAYLSRLSKDELIDLIYKRRTKTMSFEAVSTRKIAIRISYDGKSYSGVAAQRDRKTISGCILNALEMTGLGHNLTFAGRTDTGVSAINMVGSLTVISRLPKPNGSYGLVDEDMREYRYDLILNSYLPLDIRITGWAPVPEDFSARFTCIQRRYRYYFHKEDLDLEKMDAAAAKIRETRNFYELSKHSDKNARYERTLDECKIVDDGDMFYLDIRARAFLHNMVRKIMWVLLKAGRGEGYSMERVGIAEPYSLVFCGASYPQRLNFVGNHLDRDVFCRQLKADHIRYKMSRLRLECFDDGDAIR
jgi:tRNA pseudouridine38/39 synthase